MSINNVILTGRLTDAPELRYSQSGTAVAKGTIAVEDGFGKNRKSYFFEYVCFKHTATYISEYAKKGTPVTILGKLTQNKWEDDKGKHSRVVVVVNECVLPPKGTNTSGNDSSPATGKNTSSQTHSDDMAGMFGEEIVFDESGLPF